MTNLLNSYQDDPFLIGFLNRMTLPYAFIQTIRSEEDLKVDGIERVKLRILKDGLNSNDFDYCQYGHIPKRLRDSFSNQFIGERIICTVAYKRIIDND